MPPPDFMEESFEVGGARPAPAARAARRPSARARMRIQVPPASTPTVNWVRPAREAAMATTMKRCGLPFQGAGKTTSELSGKPGAVHVGVYPRGARLHELLERLRLAGGAETRPSRAPP